MYYTYVLQSEKDGQLYSGYTKNLEERFEQHSIGLVDSTKNRRPLKLIYYEACLNQLDALKSENISKRITVECSSIKGSNLISPGEAVQEKIKQKT